MFAQNGLSILAVAGKSEPVKVPKTGMEKLVDKLDRVSRELDELRKKCKKAEKTELAKCLSATKSELKQVKSQLKEERRKNKKVVDDLEEKVKQMKQQSRNSISEILAVGMEDKRKMAEMEAQRKKWERDRLQFIVVFKRIARASGFLNGGDKHAEFDLREISQLLAGLEKHLAIACDQSMNPMVQLGQRKLINKLLNQIPELVNQAQELISSAAVSSSLTSAIIPLPGPCRYSIPENLVALPTSRVTLPRPSFSQGHNNNTTQSMHAKTRIREIPDNSQQHVSKKLAKNLCSGRERQTCALSPRPTVSSSSEAFPGTSTGIRGRDSLRPMETFRQHQSTTTTIKIFRGTGSGNKTGGNGNQQRKDVKSQTTRKGNIDTNAEYWSSEESSQEEDDDDDENMEKPLSSEEIVKLLNQTEKDEICNVPLFE